MSVELFKLEVVFRTWLSRRDCRAIAAARPDRSALAGLRQGHTTRLFTRENACPGSRGLQMIHREMLSHEFFLAAVRS